MAFENLTKVYSWPAATDLSAFQYYPVTLATSSTYPDGYINTISSTATKPVGILQDTPNAAGVMAAVAIEGISKCRIYAGTVAVLDAIGVHASGYGEVTTTDNRWVVGTALEKAADDNTVPVLTIDLNVSRY